jgi:hypothetical protein
MKKLAWFLLSVAPWMAWSATEPTPAEKEWHEYCEMTVHVKVDGWVADESEETLSLPLNRNTLRCKADVGKDFLGKVSSTGHAYLGQAALAEARTIQLNVRSAHTTVSHFPEAVTDAVACAPINRILRLAQAHGGRLPAKLKRKLVRQDWTSPKNTDIRFIEEIDVQLAGGLTFRGIGNSSARGKFCSQKPKP